MQELTPEYAMRYVLELRRESKMAKRNRMLLNRDNYTMYQLEHDFSHKKKGQSKQVLSKVRDATESSKSFFQQALSDLDDWFRITARDGSDGSMMLIRPEEAQKILNYMLKKSNYYTHVGFSVQSGMLGSLSISEVGGRLVPKPKFKAKSEGRGAKYKKHVVVTDDKTWELRFDNIRQEDYYPDSTGEDTYRIKEAMVDLSRVRQLAEGDDAIYDMDKVQELRSWGDDELQEEKRARETGQNIQYPRMRPRIKITEFWGTIVDNITGELMAENVVCTIANRKTIIRKPTPNPKWHQRTPIVAAAMIEVANSVWGIAFMDAGTKHNRTLIEMFNLMLDSAMKAVWGVTQIRTDVLNDPTQLTDGIPWGTNLKVNASLPPGVKVMEEVVTGTVQSDVLNMFNLLNQEALTSMKTNDMRMGAQSMRDVKATQVVAAENSITSEFQGIAKNFEEKKIQPELELAMYEICQNWDRIDVEVFKSLFGAERGEALSKLEPQDIFVQVINGMKFEVFGISLTLRRQTDYRKYMTLLQTIGASQMLIEAFLQKYSFEKLLGEIMTAIDLNKTKIEQDQAKPPAAGIPGQPGAPASQGPGQGGPPNTMQQPGGAPGATPDQMSQIQRPPASDIGGSALASTFAGVGQQMSMRK